MHLSTLLNVSATVSGIEAALQMDMALSLPLKSSLSSGGGSYLSCECRRGLFCFPRFIVVIFELGLEGWWIVLYQEGLWLVWWMPRIARTLKVVFKQSACCLNPSSPHDAQLLFWLLIAWLWWQKMFLYSSSPSFAPLFLNLPLRYYSWYLLNICFVLGLWDIMGLQLWTRQARSLPLGCWNTVSGTV